MLSFFIIMAIALIHELLRQITSLLQYCAFIGVVFAAAEYPGINTTGMILTVFILSP